ncbi:cytidine deaminase [Nocardioides caldifontis]|uniref:cytidine deaminase n=1 Tax=Nocardioides caldifontis TaxID=2588938 RepID=UPI0011E061E9|nr:cytidine deaminase [Nocardioides caldifontis]
MPDLSAEDAKLVTLARSVRARTRAAEGACVRDQDGRTYAGATVALPSLQLSAVAVAVAMAVSSGSAGLEAVAVLGDADAVAEDDLAVVRDFAGTGVPVLRGDARGQVLETVRS